MTFPSGGNNINLGITATNSASPVIKQVAADVGGLEQSAQSAGDGVGGANSQMAGMILTAGKLTSALSIVTSVASAVGSAFEMGEVAAANERLRTSGEQLAASYGSSMDHIVAKVREASLGTVSEMDIIGSANKAMMLGLGADADQLASLMEIAALRGRAMGISTTQAFDDMVRGIGRMSPMILDNLGIVVDADSTYGAYATSLGKASSELSRAEKIQALLNRVLEEGNKMLDDAGGLAEDNASKYERWNAELENTKNVMAENASGMADLADLGADLLVAAQNDIIAQERVREKYGDLAITQQGYLVGLEKELMLQEEATAARWNAMASYYATATSVQAYAESVQAEVEVHKEAVQGAIRVQETYDKHAQKLQDLQADHADLTAKKQELINQGYWPEHDAIIKLNDKLADNEQKQRDVTEAMKGTLEQMLLNTAATGLDAEAQLALARATGQIDEAAYAALSAQMELKKAYDDGTIDADQYAKKTLELRDAVNRLESKGIKITVDAIFNEIRNKITNDYTSDTIGGGQRYASGTDGWQTVPPGYPNDTYPILMTSGERFAVIPAGTQAAPSPAGGFGGGGNTFVYAPQIGVSFGDESETKNRLYAWFLDMLEQAKADGQVR